MNSPSTPNQAALLSALKTEGARLVPSGGGYEVRWPGVPKAVLCPSRLTFLACLTRGWLRGQDHTGYRLSAAGVLAEACR